MKLTKAENPNRKMLVFGALFILLGVAALLFAPGNYWLYANFLIGMGYVFAAYYDSGWT